MKDRHGQTPYALFRTADGRTLAWDVEQVRAALAIAKVCKCGKCDCCRCAEYIREATAQYPTRRHAHEDDK